MNLLTSHEVIFQPAFALLPKMMNSQEAVTELMTIGLQESLFKHRVQLRIGSRNWWDSLRGPARGWPQFEKIGVRGVLEHPSSRAHALYILDALRYPADVNIIHKAIAHNDVLACCFARLLLWTDPRPFPNLLDSPEEWWAYYLRNWRPGKPHHDTWYDFWYMSLQATNYLHSKGMWT